MRSLKFVVLRVVVDALFVYLMYKGYTLSVSGVINIHQISPALFLAMLIGVAVYTFQSEGLMKSVMNVALCYFMFLFYKKATENGVDLLYTSFLPVVILRGILGLSIAVLLFAGFKQVISSYLKVAQIYCLSSEHNKTILGSLIGSAAKCKYTFSIPIINKIIHKSFHEIFDVLQKGNTLSKENTISNSDADEHQEESLMDKVAMPENPESPENSENSSKLENTKNQAVGILKYLENTPIARVSKRMLSVYISYLDECVLAYCYKHSDEKFLDNIYRAMKLTIKHSPRIIAKIAVLSALNYIIKIASVIAFIFYIFNAVSLSLFNIVMAYIIFKGISFIVEDAILEPMTMAGIINIYCSLVAKDEEQEKDQKSDDAKSTEGEESEPAKSKIDDSISTEELLKLAPALSKLSKHLT